ncbi:hypothetical protein ANN_01157 [Periplaneta americana]|uniref:Tc1-like transposase DDE domain-containing protein n=1 Tax=Periplaneta americana TaxID=6978 RepID=A0ABQ8TTW8_PERAM|nr:hypothetical protein ANN_01157 [Periplaneta americana]
MAGLCEGGNESSGSLKAILLHEKLCYRFEANLGVDQRSWFKIQCALDRTARQCNEGLVETCGETSLPYRTVERWVRAFNEGREIVANVARPGRPSVSDEQVHSAGCCRTVRHRVQHNLRPALRRKRQHFLLNPPFILQDSARAHVAHSVADLGWGGEVLFHSPYSPDLNPCDYDLIPNMKEPLCGIRFRTVPEILQAADRSINRTGAATGILRVRLPHRWQRVVDNVGDYVEGL